MARVLSNYMLLEVRPSFERDLAIWAFKRPQLVVHHLDMSIPSIPKGKLGHALRAGVRFNFLVHSSNLSGSIGGV